LTIYRSVTAAAAESRFGVVRHDLASRQRGATISAGISELRRL
jgi:hypothetical protein